MKYTMLNLKIFVHLKICSLKISTGLLNCTSINANTSVCDLLLNIHAARSYSHIKDQSVVYIAVLYLHL